MIRILLTVISFLAIYSSNLNAQKLKDKDLNESQKQTLKALQNMNPQMTPYSGMKGFYLYYEKKKKIQIPGIGRTGLKITDLSLFATLPNLEEISFSEVHNNSFEALKNLHRLKTLTINNPQARIDISSIFQIKTLQELSIIDCRYTTLSGIEGIEKLSNLKSLNLFNVNISNFNPISKATSLERVFLSYVKKKITDSWRKLNRLTRIKINYSDVTNTKFLKDCNAAKSISLQRNKLTSLSLPWNSLERLYVGGNKLKSLNGIEQCSKLKTLDISDNPISEIDQLTSLKQLVSLRARRTAIKDICILAKLTGLEKLLISESPYEDASCLQNLPNLKDFEGYTNDDNQPYPCSPKDLKQLKAGVACSALEAGWYGSKLHYTYILLFFFVVALLFVLRYRIKKSRQLKEL